MKNLLVFLASLFVLLSSCKDSDNSNLLPNVTGKSGEVILVIEPTQWSSNVGLEFRNQLSQPYPALPQNEPMFDLVHIPYDAFTSIFKTHRNIIFAKVDKKLDAPKLVVQKNLWANPQLIINVLAPSDSALARLVRDKGDVIVDRILRKDMERHKNNYKKYAEIDIIEKIEKKFDINITIPKGYTLDLDTTDFVWLETRGYGDVVQGILIYSYDKPEVELTTDYLFAKRNQFTKRFVAGAVPKSYMAVETEASPYRREIPVNDLKVIELRGLWKVENDFMGGPFVSFSFIDEEQNKIINIDGFVYAPQFNKRDYLKQVEAILNSVQKAKNEGIN